MALEIFRLVGSVFVDTDEANKSLQKSDKDAESLGKRLTSVAQTAGKFALGVVGAATAAGTALVAVAENTREYRTEQGKLQAAFETSGFAAGEAANTYAALNGILGDSGQAVEAANHLAKLCDNTEDLAKWTNICTGVYATFGDSLPIEGLTEAANETAKVGQVTGPLADALNWAGISEDAFNESLAACTSEQERQALITQTLSGLYTDAADKYREINGEVIAANVANDKLSASMAKVGGAVEPIVTQGKMLIAEVLERSVPYIEMLASVWIPALIAMITNCSIWISENGDKIVEWTGYIAAATAGVITFLVYINWGNIMTAASNALNTVTVSVKALNAAMNKNKVAIIVAAIVSLITYLVVLYNTNEEFRAKVDEVATFIWTKLQAVFGWLQEHAFPILKALGELFKKYLLPIIEELYEFYVSTLIPAIDKGLAWCKENIFPFIAKIVEKIGEFFDWFIGIFQYTSDSTGGIWEKIKDFFSSAWDFIKRIWEACQPFFQAVWDGVIMPVADLVEEMIGAFKMAWDVIVLVWEKCAPFFAAAWEAIKVVWDLVLPYFKAIWESIKAVFSVVVTYFGGLFKTAWEAIKAVWNVVIDYFTLVWAGIKAVFAVVKGVLSGDFSDAWEAIKNLWNRAKEFFNSVWTGIKNVFGSVGSWFGNTFKAAWEAVKKAFSSWGSFFGNLWTTIKDKFSAIGTNISNAISSAVKSGLNGVISKIESVINSGVNMINGAIGLINEIPGVNIGKLSKLSLPRLERGGVLEKGQVGLLEGNGAEAVVPLHQNEKWIRAVAEDMKSAIGGASNDQENIEQFIITIVSLLEKLLVATEAEHTITLNKREFARVVKEVG